MMKTNRYINLIAGMALVLLAACSGSEQPEAMPPEPVKGAEVSLSLVKAVTRAMTGSDGITKFQEGDQIYLYTNGLYDDMRNVGYTVTATGLTCNEDRAYNFNENNGASFYAFYPAATSANAYEANFQVAFDQSGDGTFGKSDVMTSANSVPYATADPIELSFRHRLALVKIDVNQVNAQLAADNQVAIVELNNVLTTVRWVYATDKMEPISGATRSSVSMGTNLTADATSAGIFYAVVPAQQLLADNVLISITTANGRTYNYTNSTELTLSEGTVSTFTMKMTEAGELTTISAVLTSQWGETTEQGDCTIEEFLYIPPVTTETEVTTLSGKRSELAAGEWGVLATAENFAAEVASFDGGFNFKVTTAASGYWSNRTLYFHALKSFTLGNRYLLTFTVKAEASNQMWLSVTGFDSNSKDIFYYMEVLSPTLSSYNKGARVLFTPTTTATTYKVVIDPSQTTATSTDNDGTSMGANTTQTDYFIGFCSHGTTNATTYTIQDVSLTPYITNN
ncbi:MAG: fimbrillin family protein [Bacteroides sp.]